MSDPLQKTDRTTITRHGERALYDRDAANAIIDEALVAHVGFDAGDGVIVIPMTYARINDELILHGAVASRWLSSFESGQDVCITVTLLDGLVLARSALAVLGAPLRWATPWQRLSRSPLVPRRGLLQPSRSSRSSNLRSTLRAQ